MCLLIWKKKSLYNLRLPSTQKYFYLCSWCMAKCVPRFLILGALHWLHTVKNASRVNVHQLFGCIPIQMMPFNSIMNVNYDWKSALKLSFSRKKNVKSFSKGLFRSHALYFSILLQIMDRMSKINIFQLFLILKSLRKTYTTMYPYFSASTFAKLSLLVNFCFSGMLCHYPIFLLPMDKFIVNSKQT